MGSNKNETNVRMLRRTEAWGASNEPSERIKRFFHGEREEGTGNVLLLLARGVAILPEHVNEYVRFCTANGIDPGEHTSMTKYKARL